MLIVVYNGKGGTSKTTLSLNLLSGLKGSYLSSYDLTSNLDFIKKNRLIEAQKDSRITEKLNLIEPKNNEIFEKCLSMKFEKDEKGNELTTIVDLGGYDSNSHRLALALADIIVIPTGLNNLELQSLDQISKILEEVSKTQNKVIKAKILPSRLHSQTKRNSKRFVEFEEKVKAFGCFELMKSTMYQRKDYRFANDLGCSVLEHKKTKYGLASKEIKEIIKELEL